MFGNSNITLGIGACQSMRNKGTSPILKAHSSSLAICFEFSIHSTCLSLFCFVYFHMNCSRFGILIPFSKSVALSMIAHLRFITTSNSHLSISIALCYAFAIASTFVDCCISTCTSMDGCISASTMLSSLASVFVIYASTKCYSTTSSSSNSSMNIRSTNVIPSHVYSLARQPFYFCTKTQTADVLVVFMSWIIVGTKYIFSLYAFPSAHFKDDDECNNNLIANNWIFNMPSFSTLFNSSSTYVFLNNSTSSSSLRFCSLFYASLFY